jgi:hypothetical protein
MFSPSVRASLAAWRRRVSFVLRVRETVDGGVVGVLVVGESGVEGVRGDGRESVCSYDFWDSRCRRMHGRVGPEAVSVRVFGARCRRLVKEEGGGGMEEEGEASLCA